MGRLIEADALTEVITADWFVTMLVGTNNRCDAKEMLRNCIDSVPLAYDIEKVVAELEEGGQKMSEAKSTVPFGKHSSANHKYYKAISLKRAIEIVRRGGKNE